MDGVEVSVTTSKIISEDEKKDEEMRFLRQAINLLWGVFLGVGDWNLDQSGFQRRRMKGSYLVNFSLKNFDKGHLLKPDFKQNSCLWYVYEFIGLLSVKYT